MPFACSLTEWTNHRLQVHCQVIHIKYQVKVRYAIYTFTIAKLTPSTNLYWFELKVILCYIQSEAGTRNLSTHYSQQYKSSKSWCEWCLLLSMHGGHHFLHTLRTRCVLNSRRSVCVCVCEIEGGHDVSSAFRPDSLQCWLEAVSSVSTGLQSLVVSVSDKH